MTSRSILSRAKFVRTTTTIATIFSYSNSSLILLPTASSFSPFLPSISSPSSSRRRSRFYFTDAETTTPPNRKSNRNTNTPNRSSILTAASAAIMSASQNIPTFNGSDEKSKATDFANYFCAVRCVALRSIGFSIRPRSSLF